MMQIELKNINKTYNKNSIKVNALNNINLSIEKGELVAIVGTSGSGKSSLLNILGCIDTKYEGQYLLNGKEIYKCKDKELAIYRNTVFGFVLQYYGLLNNYSVFDNVKMPLLYGKKKEKQETIIKMLEKFNISDKINSKPSELSGGQCQRVAIARALINNPEIILADEPTGALDKNTSREVIDILLNLNKEGKTVIIVTHDEKIAAKCSRIIRIEYGEITEDSKYPKKIPL